MIFVFRSTHAVLCAEKVLQRARLAYRIVPTPRAVSSECGMSIRPAPDSAAAAHRALRAAGLKAELYEEGT